VVFIKGEPEFFEHGGEKVPYLHFRYEGLVPKYEAGNPHHVMPGGAVHHRTRYIEDTFKQYDFSKINLRFEQACIIIIHHFKDGRGRDLDNLNSKYLVDAVRRTAVIKDDSWQHLSHLLFGARGEEDFVEVYLVSRPALIPLLEAAKILELE